MKPEVKAIILEALDMKIASAKRAKNSSKNPAFGPIYDLEVSTAEAAKVWINEQK